MSEPQPERLAELSEAHGLVTADAEGVAAWGTDLRATLSTRVLEWLDQLFTADSAFSALAEAMTLLPWLLALGAAVVVALGVLRMRRLWQGRAQEVAAVQEEALTPVLPAADHQARARAALEAGAVEEAIGASWAWVRAQLSERGWGPLSDDLTHGEVVRAVRRAGATADTVRTLAALARAMDRWRYGGEPPELADARQALALAEQVVP